MRMNLFIIMNMGEMNLFIIMNMGEISQEEFLAASSAVGQHTDQIAW